MTGPSTQALSTPNLAADPKVQRVRKRPIPVRVSFAAADGVVATYEGDVRHRAGDAILTGAEGERWPIRRNDFVQSYVPVPPTCLGEDGLYVKTQTDALALRLAAAVTIAVGDRRDRLHGRPGDWLLQYGDGSYGVVRDAIFQVTYERLPG
jgi:hypothetical protein